ncbi:hypothetical protein FS749_014137 [Ceratobasidium sp. UAMH 11750]|nr:hypothetical protein FS749_014137 [Ceratobasidium sp. UAMH 11750]
MVTFQVFNANQFGKARSNFLDLMARCPGPFTELKVLEVADEANVLPISILLRSDGSQPPSFTLQPGDIGTYADDHRPGGFQWYPIKSQIVADQDSSEWEVRVQVVTHVTSEYYFPVAIIGADGWYTLKLPHDYSYVSWYSSLHEPIDWKSLVARWAGIVNKTQLESLCLCHAASTLIQVNQRGSLPDNNNFYFHRCPTARSDPQAFWGYFSSNIDPTAREDNLENKGWIFEYDLRAVVYKFVDGWGYKYKQLLKQSIKSMPGSFPGVETEDSSDGEDE